MHITKKAILSCAFWALSNPTRLAIPNIKVIPAINDFISTTISI